MRLRRFASAAAGIAAAAAVCAPAAGAQNPAPGFEEFKGCPNQPDVQQCIYVRIDGGHLKLGSKNTPIQNPIEISGGIRNFQELVFNSQGGMTSPRQQVPGGVIGITGLDWLTNFFPFSALKLYARAVPVGAASSPVANPSTMSLKIKLESTILSNTCYIGSDSNPINFTLTRGTTSPPPPAQPITGQEPAITPDPNVPGKLLMTNGVNVDNAFSVPTANGCGLLLPNFSIINPLVNLQAGLPSAAGNNEARFEYDGALAPRTRVYPSS